MMEEALIAGLGSAIPLLQEKAKHRMKQMTKCKIKNKKRKDVSVNVFMAVSCFMAERQNPIQINSHEALFHKMYNYTYPTSTQP